MRRRRGRIPCWCNRCISCDDYLEIFFISFCHCLEFSLCFVICGMLNNSMPCVHATSFSPPPSLNLPFFCHSSIEWHNRIFFKPIFCVCRTCNLIWCHTTAMRSTFYDYFLIHLVVLGNFEFELLEGTSI